MFDDRGKIFGYVQRPVEQETPCGCILGMIGTFTFLMFLGALSALGGDTEAANWFKDIGAGLYKIYRVIFTPIFIIMSFFIMKYVFILSLYLGEKFYKETPTKSRKLVITIIIACTITIFLLYKLAMFIRLI
ncbi:hypothetical protein [Mammaliicoccus sciuri]|uniref:hypothetical protein n=1 Tax=Mammaliicoccus sciuri TaxID=1296 RepID=UPI001E4BC542|nr:hypothetical protein [Mammaliicoccus sciuri]MCD8796618.1 hypothetical protein [Mammaliicoccus sciuri]